MEAFDPNDYRKRVLAGVERRGGIEHSDPFELYDIPLAEAETLSDAEVAARVAEVWGFWQRQRDHPKYRVLVGLLVDAHSILSGLMLVAGTRRAEAARVRERRAQRDADRYDMLDTAISRLVQRYGGVPAGKVEGLTEIGAMGGLTAAEVATRMRRHRVIADAEPAAPSVLTDQRRRQIRQLLAEWERLLEGPPTPTLFALLRVDSTNAGRTREIRLRAEALRARSRELPPGRVRVVLDELLVHVHDVLESGDAAIAEYLRAVAEDVAAELRPKVRAAVLVEDELVGTDFQYLLDEAVALGLDRAGATRLLTGLAAELGASVEDSSHGVPPRTPTSSDTSLPRTAPRGTTAPRPRTASTSSTSPTRSGTPVPRQWEAPLKAARAALRAGRPSEAARQVAEARRLLGADDDGLTPIRSVADEVDRVLATAAAQWRSASAACAAKRYVEAVPYLESLQRTASDVPPPQRGRTLDELLAEARAAIAEADRLVAAAQAGPAEALLRGLLDAKAICADHEGAAAALAQAPVEAPARVEATRTATGSVLVVWSPSSTATVDYRVTRLQPEGSWRVVGRTRATELEDGGAPAGRLPVYAVAAAVAGKYSEITRSDTARTLHPGAESPKQLGEQQLSLSEPALDDSIPASTDPEVRPMPAQGDPGDSPGAAVSSSDDAVPATGDDRHSPRDYGYSRGDGEFSPERRGNVQSHGATSPVEPEHSQGRPQGDGGDSSGEHASSPAESEYPLADRGRSDGDRAPAQDDPAYRHDDPASGGIPTVTGLAEQNGLLVFTWPSGVTEVMVVIRADEPPSTSDDPCARAWKVTNMRYEIDGGVRIPEGIDRPCHIAIASCRRDATGKLTVAIGFADTARIHWER
ncbi:Ig-like domain repeat protein [Nocardia sp. NBC_01009]|uniref:Ig-like domain repeat protein n=1 Tax=Nocardia sp. NBC_01009 TaxID=2975996 RepID=UPI00386B7FAC|nr:Ig-like domain repeat protein [Nocardia sp. NBC_01009]